MVVKRRLPIAITTAAALVLAAVAPVSAAWDKAAPDPLRSEDVLRAQDIQAVAASSKYGHGPAVAIGWREASKYYLTFSLDGGKSYKKANGTMRRAPVVGEPKAGMSLDICAGKVWMGTAVNLGSGSWPTDIVLSSRDIVGSPNGRQGLITTSGIERKVDDVSVSCVSDKLLAIGWLEQRGGKNRVRLVLRSLELPGETPKFRRNLGLGEGRFKGGIDVAATAGGVHVAWSIGSNRNIAYKRILIGDEKKPTITKKDTRTVGWSFAEKPKLSARGSKVTLAYIDGGRVKVKVSRNEGAAFEKAGVVVAGTKQNPSRVHSIDVAGSRIVVGATANKAGQKVSTRVVSNNLGKTWKSSVFGNNGARLDALLKRGSSADPLIRETWHNAASGKDTLRARYEKA